MWFLGTGKVIKAFRKAVEQFHKRTCIRFEKKTRKDIDYIEIFQGTGWVFSLESGYRQIRVYKLSWNLIQRNLSNLRKYEQESKRLRTHEGVKWSASECLNEGTSEQIEKERTNKPTKNQRGRERASEWMKNKRTKTNQPTSQPQDQFKYPKNPAMAKPTHVPRFPEIGRTKERKNQRTKQRTNEPTNAPVGQLTKCKPINEPQNHPTNQRTNEIKGYPRFTFKRSRSSGTGLPWPIVKTIRLWARDFYEVIVDEAEGRINYRLIAIESRILTEIFLLDSKLFLVLVSTFKLQRIRAHWIVNLTFADVRELISFYKLKNVKLF